MIENHEIKQNVLSFVEQYCNTKCVINLRTIRNQLSKWYMIDDVHRCLWNLYYNNKIELKCIGGLDYEICIIA